MSDAVDKALEWLEGQKNDLDSELNHQISVHDAAEELEKQLRELVSKFDEPRSYMIGALYDRGKYWAAVRHRPCDGLYVSVEIWSDSGSSEELLRSLAKALYLRAKKNHLPPKKILDIPAQCGTFPA